MAIRDCNRCTAPCSSTGNRCRIRTCKTGPYCWRHALSINNLRVKDSKIPHAGLGLFAAKARSNQTDPLFKPGDFICEYDGDIINGLEKDRLQRKGKDRYLYQLKQDLEYIDARRTNSCLGRYANDCRKTKFKCNAYFSRPTRGRMAGRVSLKARRNINNGDEILISYGAGYWAKHDQPKQRMTKNSRRVRGDR